MSNMTGVANAGLPQLVQEIKLASENIQNADSENRRRLDQIEKSLNELYVRQNRPGGS